MKGLFFKVHTILKERGIKIRFFENEKKALKIIKGKEIITNDSEFTVNLLQEAGFHFFHVVDRASLQTVEIIKEEMQSLQTKEIVAIGGGKAIDVGKKIAADLGIDLISFPTAPSHDGLISRNCSLYIGNKRKTIPAVYPKKLFIPLNLWRNSGNLRKAGICDLISNYVALQDISLAERKGEKFKSLYKFLSFEATKLINSSKEKHLAYALIFSGLAMEETSRYCSGSEHEVERLIESKLTNTYLHGQLAGTGTLIASRVYAEFKDRFSNLRFDPKKLFNFVVEEMKKNNVLDFALLPLKDERFKTEWLKELSAVRPERYTLWNRINSQEVNWDKIIEEIKSLK
ncbi:iron-containing alcohol dehydrogenase [bacterium]|nr:iron-containing alcohol dehydrogenase [bacterium]